MNQKQKPENLPDLQVIIDEFLNNQEEMGYAPSVIKFYKSTLRRLAQRCPDLPWSHEDVAAAVERPERTWETQRRMRACADSFLDWAERRHGIPSPFRPAV